MTMAEHKSRDGGVCTNKPFLANVTELGNSIMSIQSKKHMSLRLERRLRHGTALYSPKHSDFWERCGGRRAAAMIGDPTHAHRSTLRKGKDKRYILHPISLFIQCAVSQSESPVHEVYRVTILYKDRTITSRTGFQAMTRK